MQLDFFITPFLLCLTSGFALGLPYVEGEVLVTFKLGVTQQEQDSILERQDVRLGKRFHKIKAAKAGGICLARDGSHNTAKLIQKLKGHAEILNVEPNYIRSISKIIPNDTAYNQLWALENTGQFVNLTSGQAGVDINFSSAWRLARPENQEIVVGIIDTGIDIDHPDLRSNLWKNTGEIPWDGIDNDGNGKIDDIHGYDFAANSARIADTDGHGTHVAGTVAAAGRNGIGVIGVDFKTKFIPMAASINVDSILTSATIEAYEYAIDLKQRGVNIVAINASYGGSQFLTAERNAIIALRDAGIILCAAAGNEQVDNDLTPTYPANYDVSNIISVAAITSNNQLASFSNFGANSVDIAAPGQNIYSTNRLSDFSFISEVKVGNVTYLGQAISEAGSVIMPGITGNIIRCGIGNPGDFPNSVRGNIAFIQRGSINFSDKVKNAMRAGALGVIIDDNSDDDLTKGAWQLDKSQNYIPAVRITQASGIALMAQLPTTGNLVNGPSASLIYRFRSGTSMATPHVTGTVAFAARNYPDESINQRMSRVLGNATPSIALNGKMTHAARIDLLGVVDTDRDLLPDWWETQFFQNLTQSAISNMDGDPFPNRDEFLASTSPLSAASQLEFSLAQWNSANDFRFQFKSELDTNYAIQQSENLSQWTPYGSTIFGTGGLIDVNDTNLNPQVGRRFYRIGVVSQ